MFSGSLVALITPFRDGKVDEPKLRELVDFHVRNGTNGLVPCGTTGESVTMTEDEHNRVVEIVVETAAGRLPVVAGTGTNDTAKTIKLTKSARKLGADGALIVTPYYNKPTPEGLFRHYQAVAAAVDIPIVLYNVPGRTSVNMAPETVARLSKIPTIVGIKEASGSIDQSSQIVTSCRPDFVVLSGDDSLTLPIMSVGGVGIISVVGNITPRPVADMVAAFRAGDVVAAQKIHVGLFDLCRAMFYETNPIPVKTAAGILGLCSDEVRLPLCPMSEGNLKKLRDALSACPYTQPVAVR